LKDKLKVGIAGYGVVGQRRRECVDLNPDLSLVAVCDQLFESNGEVINGVIRFKDFKNLLNEDIDILFVCLTNDIAATVTIAGLESGKHVFCEKPPGRNIEDIKRVISAEKKFPKLKLMYGFNHRYHDSVKEVFKIIKSKSLGEIINLRGVYGKSKLVTFNQPDWRTKRKIAGGGVLLDQGIHMLDLMRFFAGEFQEVYSFVDNNHWKYDVEDNAYAIMRNKKGVVGMINSSATQWRHRFQLDINFQNGSLILGGILSGSKSYGAETLTKVLVDSNNDGNPKEEVIHYDNDPSWYDEIVEFIKCINDNSHVLSGSSNDALETMKLVYKIYYADPSWRIKYNIDNPNI
jgi:predicted dehydrogenase